MDKGETNTESGAFSAGGDLGGDKALQRQGPGHGERLEVCLRWEGCGPTSQRPLGTERGGREFGAGEEDDSFILKKNESEMGAGSRNGDG